MFINCLIGIVQSAENIQLSLFNQLDMPHGHRDLNHNNKDIILLDPTNEFSKCQEIQHKIFPSEELNYLLYSVFEQLLRKYNNTRITRRNSQEDIRRVFEDRGFNSDVSTIKNTNKKRKRTLSFDIAIPDTNVREGEDPMLDKVFRLLSKYILLSCLFL